MFMSTVQMGRRSIGWSQPWNWLAITDCLPFNSRN